MNTDKLFNLLKRTIIFVASIIILAVIAYLIYVYGGSLKFLVSGKAKQTNAFEDYDVVKRYGSGIYNVEFRDLITSAGGMERHYYRYDLTVQAEDQPSADKMIDTRKQVITLINGVMSNFETSEMNTEAERNRVKKIIQSEITGHYPNIKVKDIYFTNFLYD
ncbi:flagellar basal body-associated protein FliL [Denitrovibrio acetiphilus DSM 12809]|uniref:Flagellar protein FliL n=1 Tax=Denitrovibrio acetiphilus (strain DSM 12809 / NBRC 114555 / N2460) TaxID=522772 RepID=D4H5J3_DENA2|nr:flagellar basal body-associated FliL family protein [Denitrovibrio acetiphilus]ADD67613.1 flagellar basal body-associated protein FliL [Denitrovibrio acetiphilus DSM 12809]